MAGLFDNLTNYMRAVGAGISANNNSPLASGLSSFASASKARGLASGLSNYVNAAPDDAEVKRMALSQMASADPTSAANFIVKNKIADNGLVNTEGYGKTTAGLALSIINDPKATPEALTWAKNQLASNGIDYQGNLAYTKESRKLDAQATGKPQVIAAETPYIVDQERQKQQAVKDVALTMNPQITAATTQAEQAAQMPFFMQKQDYTTDAEKQRAQNNAAIKTQQAVEEIKATTEPTVARERAVATARETGKDYATAVEELNENAANMPALMATVDDLKQLANDATYTYAGQGFDFLAKQGLGITTKGAAARAEFEAKVNNVVLPLLRQTFGAQMTEREGERLQKALASPNDTPEQKLKTLEAFVAQQMKNLESKRRKVNAYRQEAQPIPETISTPSKEDALAELRRRGII